MKSKISKQAKEVLIAKGYIKRALGQLERGIIHRRVEELYRGKSIWEKLEACIKILTA